MSKTIKQMIADAEDKLIGVNIHSGFVPQALQTMMERAQLAAFERAAEVAINADIPDQAARLIIADEIRNLRPE